MLTFSDLDAAKVARQQCVDVFARENIEPLANLSHIQPEQWRILWQKMAEMGLHGITVSPELGGAGLSFLDHVLVMEIISRYSGSIGLSYVAHSQLCVNQLARYASNSLQLACLQDLIAGKKIGALALTEPEAGSDAANIRLRADKQGDGYVLNGRKIWITNAPIADAMVVYANTDMTAGKHGITAFLVDSTCDGWTATDPIEKVGMCASPTAEVVFADCYLEPARIIGSVGQGMEIMMSGLDLERLVLAAGPLGLMQAALDSVLPYVSHRHQFGQPLSSFQMIQSKVADMTTGLEASRAYVYQAAACFDRGQGNRELAASVLLFASEQANRMASEAVQCLGGNGYAKAYPVGRIWQDAKLYDIGGGTNEIRRYLIARETLKRVVHHEPQVSA